MVIKNALDYQSKSSGFSAFILAAAYLISALLGLFRDRLLAGTFGAGDALDAYYAAFKIPDFIATVFIMGAISSAIVPLFSQYLIRSKQEAWEFVSSLLNVFFLILLTLVFLLIIFAPYLIFLVAPGFAGEKKELTIMLTRVMLLSPLILGLSNIISGILQVFHRFVVTSLAPILYNIGIIFGIFFFVPAFGVTGLAWGVVLGGLLHLFTQLPIFLRVGYAERNYITLMQGFRHKGVLQALKLMVPRFFGLAATQVNAVIMTAIASTLISGSIAVLNLANNLASALIGLIAVPFSVAIFPVLSLRFSEGNMRQFINDFLLVCRRIIFLVLPLSLLFFVLRDGIVDIVYKLGNFGIEEAKLTSSAIGLFSLGILAQSLIILFSRAFFSLSNTRTPAVSSLFAVLCNIAFTFYFIFLFSHKGNFSSAFYGFFSLNNIENIKILALPLALSISAFLQALFLGFFLRKSVIGVNFKELLIFFLKVFTGSAVGAFVASFIFQSLDINVFWQTAVSGFFGLIVYIIIAYLFNFMEFKNMADLAGSFLRKSYNGRK